MLIWLIAATMLPLSVAAAAAATRFDATLVAMSAHRHACYDIVAATIEPHTLPLMLRHYAAFAILSDTLPLCLPLLAAAAMPPAIRSVAPLCLTLFHYFHMPLSLPYRFHYAPYDTASLSPCHAIVGCYDVAYAYTPLSLLFRHAIFAFFAMLVYACCCRRLRHAMIDATHR